MSEASPKNFALTALFLKVASSSQYSFGIKLFIEIRDFFQRSAVSPEITLNDLADFLGLSHSRTSHVLKEEFGKTFNELLNASRIKRACDLLLTTQLSLKRIAHLSGFSNEYYFGRVFKKHTNLPPGAYRKRFSPEMIAAVNSNTTAEISGSSGT